MCYLYLADKQNSICHKCCYYKLSRIFACNFFLWVYLFKIYKKMSLTCPSSMSPLRIPGGLSSVLLVRRIDKLWALRFCLGWRDANAEPLLLPPSTGIPPTSWEALPPCSPLTWEPGNSRPSSGVDCSARTTGVRVKRKWSSGWQSLQGFAEVMSTDTK